MFSFSLPPGNNSFNYTPRGHPTLRRQCVRHALQYVMPTLYGRDQSPGVPRGVDGDGAVFYRAGMRSGLLGWVLHAGRYVIRFPGRVVARLHVYHDLSHAGFHLFNLPPPPPKRALSA